MESRTTDLPKRDLMCVRRALALCSLVAIVFACQFGCGDDGLASRYCDALRRRPASAKRLYEGDHPAAPYEALRALDERGFSLCVSKFCDGCDADRLETAYSVLADRLWLRVTAQLVYAQSPGKDVSPSAAVQMLTEAEALFRELRLSSP